MSQLVVRHAEPGDSKTVAIMIEEIERHYGATTIQPFDERLAQVEQALFGAPPLAQLVLALSNGEIIGMAAYSFLWPAAGATHSLFLKELYVRPDRRRLGTGRRLVQEVRDIAAARPGCSRMEWMTDRGNDAARQFYRHLGFEELEGKVNYRIADHGEQTA